MAWALPILDSHFRLDTAGWVGILVSVLVAALFIMFAAKLLGEREGYLTAILVALVGGVLSILIRSWVGGTLGLVLAIAVWALVAAAFYRTRWLKGLVIGLLAGLLFWLASLAVAALF